MRSLSDVYKMREVIETRDFVTIPDVIFPESAEPSAEPIEPIPEPVEAIEEAIEDMAELDADAAVQDDVDAKQEEPVEELPPILTREEIEAQNQAELEKIRKAAAEQAYHDALVQKRGELKECIGKVENLLHEMQAQHARYVERYMRELKFLAIDIAEKVILQKIQEDDMILQEMVVQSAASVKTADWLTVELSEHLLSLVDFMKQELRKPAYPSQSEVIPMACPDDTCRINTQDGTLVSTISVQMDNLRKAFQNAE